MLTYPVFATILISMGRLRNKQQAGDRHAGIETDDGAGLGSNHESVPGADLTNIVLAVCITQRTAEAKAVTGAGILDRKGEHGARRSQLANERKKGIETAEIDQHVGGADQVGA